MTWLADEKDAIKVPVTQAAEYLTSQRNGLHFGGRRRDTGRFSGRVTLPTHTCTHSPRGLGCLIALYYLESPPTFFF